MRWAAQAHAVLPAGGCLGGTGQARQNQRQRAGPEGVDQLLGKQRHFLGVARDGGRIGHMHDQRMVGGPALGAEDMCHGRVVVAVGGQAVDRLGRQTEQLAGLQCLGGGLDRCIQLSIQNHVSSLKTLRCPEWRPLSVRWRVPARAWRR